MNDNILVFSDTHIYHSHAKSKPQDTGFSIRENEHLAVADELAKAIKDHSPSDVIFCGDLCHELGQVSVRCLTVAVEFIKRIYKACREIDSELWLLVGNHDVATINSNTLDIFCFAELKGLHIINENTVAPEKEFIFLPYVQNAENVKEWLDEIPMDERNRYVVFSHIDIKGADYGSGLLATKGVSISDLAGFERVFQGHYHVPQELGDNITVVGSPQRWGFKDPGANKVRGYCIYDRDTKNVERYSLQKTPVGDWLIFTDDNIGDALTIEHKDWYYVRFEVSSDAILEAYGLTAGALSEFRGYDIQLDVSRIGSVRRRDSSINNDIIYAESNEEVLAEIISQREELSDSEKEALKNKGGKLLAKYQTKTN